MHKLCLAILVGSTVVGCGSDKADTMPASDTLQPAPPQATLDGTASSDRDVISSVNDTSSSEDTSSNAECIDLDGDGWGWNGTTSCATENTTRTQSDAVDNCERLQTGQYHITELVTDVILTAGQSNATGDSTTYDPANFDQDRVSGRLIAWTENDSWEIANPATQSWHSGKYPSGRGPIYNHPAFQIGRAITNSDECRVVAIIATAAAGRPIDYWRNNDENHYQDINSTVTTALNALPGRYNVDMIWWMQGEADNDPDIDRYFYKLNDLIDTFRTESWFESTGYFLANETGWFEHANTAIRLLRSDDDTYTDFSRGEDSAVDSFPNLPIDGAVRTHFNAVALRKIGDLVASKYLLEYLPSVSNRE